MNYFAYDRMGSCIKSPTPELMLSLLASVSPDDPEHADVSLNTEDGWALSYQPSLVLIFENVETGEGPLHLNNISLESALKLWVLLADGKVSELQKLDWQSGYGNS